MKVVTIKFVVDEDVDDMVAYVRDVLNSNYDVYNLTTDAEISVDEEGK